MVRLQRRELVLPESYPRFTLVLQAIGSARLALEGLRQVVPEVPLSSPPPSLSLLPPSQTPSHLLFHSKLMMLYAGRWGMQYIPDQNLHTSCLSHLVAML